MMARTIQAAAACLDDLASGTLSGTDAAREREAAKGHVERLHQLAEVLPQVEDVLANVAELSSALPARSALAGLRRVLGES